MNFLSHSTSIIGDSSTSLRFAQNDIGSVILKNNALVIPSVVEGSQTFFVLFKRINFILLNRHSPKALDYTRDDKSKQQYWRFLDKLEMTR